MRRLIWAGEAVSDLDTIASYIGLFKPIAARRLAERLKAAATSLVDNPDRGRPVRGNIRELVVIHPYLVRYRIDEEAVVILRIRHGARRGG